MTFTTKNNNKQPQGLHVNHQFNRIEQEHYLVNH